jgi:hypothetical protein
VVIKTYFAFIGDGDGICTAHQLYLKNRLDFKPITDVKRDIALLKKAEQVSNSDIYAFDISVEKNLPYLKHFADQNCRITRFDHHISHEQID